MQGKAILNIHDIVAPLKVFQCGLLDSVKGLIGCIQTIWTMLSNLLIIHLRPAVIHEAYGLGIAQYLQDVKCCSVKVLREEINRQI
jgi:hypothetical protein